MTNNRNIFMKLLIGWIAITWVQSTNAAVITTNVAKSEINIAESTSIEIVLGLDPAEQASVFEGRFGLVGLGSIADASLTEGGPTWSSSVGNISGTQAIVSLTSNNQGSERLIATLDITGLTPGIFDVVLDQPTLASFDIPAAPFLQDLNITNVAGVTLASVKVVPLPPALGLLGLSIGILTFVGRKKQQK